MSEQFFHSIMEQLLGSLLGGAKGGSGLVQDPAMAKQAQQLWSMLDEMSESDPEAYREFLAKQAEAAGMPIPGAATKPAPRAALILTSQVVQAQRSHPPKQSAFAAQLPPLVCVWHRAFLRNSVQSAWAHWHLHFCCHFDTFTGNILHVLSCLSCYGVHAAGLAGPSISTTAGLAGTSVCMLPGLQ